MGCLAGFLRNLQDIYTKHNFTSTVCLCLLLVPPTFFYTLYATSHLSNVFLTNYEDANNFVGATFHYITVTAQVEGFAVLGICVFSLLTTPLHILGSQQKIDPEAELSIKSLISIITKPARSFLVTWFFVRLLKLGYMLLGILLVFHQHITFIDYICYQQAELSALSSVGTIILVAVGVVIFAYLGTFGNLATEIAVREGISGTKALEKASQILQGKRKVIGFVVNLVLGVGSVGLFVCYVYLNTCPKVSVDSKNSIMSSLWNFGICQVAFYNWISFSIMYSICNISPGETGTPFQHQGTFKHILLQDD